MAIADRVKDTSVSTGAGNFVLSGSAPSGFQALSAIGTVGATFGYVIDGGAEWESGTGTITAANTFSRAPSASSNAGALVNFSAGTKTVFHDATAAVLTAGLVDPSDVGFDIVLCWGQSKMAGRGTVDTVIDVADSRIWQYGGAGGHLSQIFQAVDPLAHPDGSVGVGPALSFGRAYLASRPSNRMLLLVPTAEGGTAMVGSTWQAGNPGGARYEFAIAQMNAALAAAQALYPTSRVVGGIGDQGEQDGFNGVTQAVYNAAQQAVWSGFRARITGGSGMWFVAGGIIPEAITANPSWNPVRLAQEQACLETSKTWFVAAPSGKTSDNLHLTAAGSRLHGYQMGLAARLAAAYTATPVAATAVVMSGPTSGVVSVASTNFTVSIANQIAGTVRVTPSDSAGGGTFTPAFCDLLTGTSSGTFTYTPASAGAKTISVTNNGGLSNPANITYTVVAAATAPATMTAPVATAGDTTASVALTAPSNGGSAITGYTVTSIPAGGVDANAGTTALTHNMTGLTNGTAYTFTATATNGIGTSAASPASNSVTPTAAVASFATWNPADKHANLTLSNANKTVTGGTSNSDAWTAVRSTVSKTAGKWYWEITSGGGTTILGAAQADTALTTFPGAIAGGVGLQQDGSFYGATANGAFSAWVAGDVLGFALDMDARTLTFYKNGVKNSSGTYAIGGTGAIFAMLGSRERTTTAFSHVANFGAPAFAYTPPTGYVGLQ